MNKVVLIGRLTADPEHRNAANGGNVARYTLAVDRPKREGGEQGADFIRCVAFGNLANFAVNYLHKGMKIAVTGHIHTGSYEDKDGKRVYTSDIVVESHEFCERKQDSGYSSNSGQYAQNSYTAPDAGFSEIDDCDDPPF